MLRLLVCCLALLLCGAAPAGAEGLQLRPFDEAGKDPRLRAFRDALLVAVKQRDLENVVQSAAPDILLSFGEDTGPETLRSWLSGADRDRAEQLWRDLEEVLSHGGGFDQQGGFSAPYWFAAVPALPEDTDWYAVVYVIGDKVRLRAGPGTEFAVRATLSYEVVMTDDPNEILATGKDGMDWYKVRTLDKRQGWIRGDFLRGPYGYRAGFELRGGQWMMTYFLAGD